MSDEKTISRLIDTNTLQKLQDTFADMMDLALITVSPDDHEITRMSTGAHFPKEGLPDYVAPITVDGTDIGYLKGFESKEYEHDRQRYAKNSVYLSTITDILASMAEAKAHLLAANREVMQAANLKSDFLANMSHEIRTPMNAVIGMAEMALREDLPDHAREYITQIKSSGHSLLNLINDILDFSKIESGKMDIIPVEYEPVNLFNEVSNIVITRLKGKPVQLLLEIAPSLPKSLFGDSMRIRQVLINLAGNAVKFTKRGRVKIIVDFETVDRDNILLRVQVKDTGIGIKPEDLKNLFQSFQQVDSKRNRNVEGTGLGLAISKRLVEQMNGSIHVESEYEKGSTFSFEIPQKVVDSTPCIQVENADNIVAFGYFGNRYLARQFYLDTNRLKVFSSALMEPAQFTESLETYAEEIRGKQVYLFFERFSYEDGIRPLLTEHPDVTGIMLVDFFEDFSPDLPNLRVFKEPLSSLSIAMALNNRQVQCLTDESRPFAVDFTAPDAEILVVDDNPVNLTVTRGLLEPLKMKITCAESGREAIEKLGQKRFDLIFMDHMMPEMDGVETTRIIRRLHPSYNDVPIIALTANAVGGTKELFLSEGMNDFVAKPIEMQTITRCVRQWLPSRLIRELPDKTIREVSDKPIRNLPADTPADSVRPGSGTAETSTDPYAVIGDLDTATARRLLGSDSLYQTILEAYYRHIEEKAILIKRLEMAKDWKNYTVEVHSLKSSSRQIGAMKLGDRAAALEAAGNAEDVMTIREGTDSLLEAYVALIPVLKPLCDPDAQEYVRTTGTDSPGKPYEINAVSDLFEQLHEAVEELDMDAMEQCMDKLQSYEYPEKLRPYMEKLSLSVSNVDVEACDEIIMQFLTNCTD